MLFGDAGADADDDADDVAPDLFCFPLACHTRTLFSARRTRVASARCLQMCDD